MIHNIHNHIFYYYLIICIDVRFPAGTTSLALSNFCMKGWHLNAAFSAVGSTLLIVARPPALAAVRAIADLFVRDAWTLDRTFSALARTPIDLFALSPAGAAIFAALFTNIHP